MKTNHIIQQSKRAVKRFSLFTLLFSFAIASCNREELAPQVEPTTFTLSVDRIESRATNTTTPARYVMEVWSEDGTQPENVFEDGTTNHAETTSGNSFTAVLDSMKAYTCLFWADDDATFDAASLKAVGLNSGKEITEAYHAKATIEKGKNRTVTVTLKRAVAKITLIEASDVKTTDDLTIKFTNIYPQFSVEKGEATGTAAPWTKTVKPAATTGTIATFYLFGKPVQELTELTFTYASNAENRVSNVPYQTNYDTNIKGEYANQFTASFNITADCDWNTPDNEVEFPEKLKIGSYYYKDGTWSSTYTADAANPCLGIVFVVNADSTSGKIVGLDEPEANWNGGTNLASSLTWGPNSTTTAATNELNGLVNMATIKALDNTFTNYPAFAWVHSKNPANTDYSTATKGVWYLPATKELRQLYAAMSGLKWVASGAVAANGEIDDWGNNAEMDKYSNYASARTAFNAKLTTASGTEISTNRYWSSTENENDGSLAWNVIFGDGITLNGDKLNDDKVRAVSAF